MAEGFCFLLQIIQGVRRMNERELFSLAESVYFSRFDLTLLIFLHCWVVSVNCISVALPSLSIYEILRLFSLMRQSLQSIPANESMCPHRAYCDASADSNWNSSKAFRANLAWIYLYGVGDPTQNTHTVERFHVYDTQRLEYW